jgi:hypothetical protein
MRTVPRLCEVYPGICLTTEEKAQENLSQGTRRMPVGTMKTEYTEQSSLCEVYPGICLTTEEKAQENLSQGTRRMPVGTMKTEYTEQSIRNNKNT